MERKEETLSDKREEGKCPVCNCCHRDEYYWFKYQDVKEFIRKISKHLDKRWADKEHRKLEDDYGKGLYDGWNYCIEEIRSFIKDEAGEELTKEAEE